jgi:hypothetical protein
LGFGKIESQAAEVLIITNKDYTENYLFYGTKPPLPYRPPSPSPIRVVFETNK